MQRWQVGAAGALALAGLAHAGPDTAASAADDDAYAWLEQIDAPRALDWVRAHNAATSARFMASRDFESSRKRLLEVFDSQVRIPYVERMGDHLYNFWAEGTGAGVWRRTTLEEYRKPFPEWTTLINLTRLSRASGAHWVWRGAQCLKPEYRRCLVSLSPGGRDAVEIREFDVAQKAFVDDGFVLPLAKSTVNWIDQDHVYVATDFGPGSLTDAGYPRIVKQWRRGTPLESAITVFQAGRADLAVSASHDATAGFERDLVAVAKDFFHGELYLRHDGRLVRIDVPSDARFDVHREWLLVEPRSPWTAGATTWPAGSLLAMRFDAFLAGSRDFVPLFRPDPHAALSSWSWTRNHLLLETLVDVQSRLEVLTPGEGGWQRAPMAATPEHSAVRVVDTDPDRGDEYWLSVAGFLTPSALQRGEIGAGQAEPLKHQPDFFGAAWYDVSQHFATSTDGTRVPYFQIAPRGMQADGRNRTLLYGYGGFGVSQRPSYNASLGRAWLQRGGVYVVANIRGGGEYGPAWHDAALRAGRPRAYEDFAAVARDLVRRGVTSPAHLGAEGTSNGGLLVGNMLTAYPDLFGAIACEFPLLDMRRYPHIAAGASWLAEYGDPDGADWDYLQRVSPYANLRAQTRYPPVLFVTSTRDDRVGPAHARKMAARMEGLGLKDVWLYENVEGGHGAGASDRDEAKMQALVYEFLWTKLQ